MANAKTVRQTRKSSPKKGKSKKATIKKVSKKKLGSSFIVITNKSYGKSLQGMKIYFEGKKPTQLRKDGSISFGKNILELLMRTYTKFHWILTPDTNDISLRYGIYRIRTSVKTVQKMYGESYDRARDVKEDIILKTFSKLLEKPLQMAPSCRGKLTIFAGAN